MSAKISRDSHPESHCRHNAEAGNHDPVDPRILFASEVLAREAQVCLINRIHGVIDESLNILGCRISRHRDRTEGIDRGLNQNIGNRKYCALHSRRKAYLNDLTEF